jgi:hypothetical protein
MEQVFRFSIDVGTLGLVRRMLPPGSHTKSTLDSLRLRSGTMRTLDIQIVLA